MPIEKSLVYVIQAVPDRNMTDALRFGDLYDLLPNGNVSRLPEQLIMERLYDALSDYRRHDFLILMGDPELFGIAMAICLERVGMVNVLKWDKMREKYFPRTYKK